MKKLIILLIVLNTSLMVYAEEKIQRHGLSVDLFGMGGIITVEYQYKLFSNNKHSLSINAGLGLGGLFYSAPVGLQYSYGGKNIILAGIYILPEIIANEYDPGWTYYTRISPKFGYQRKTQLFFQDTYLHIYFSPMIDFDFGRFIPWFGLGIMQNF
ncbi:MAG: hypothetical protein U9Q91_00470 [Candidatus Marinimicrobia bacterium]|nr:hypothetical protein [Candidatus Neomarinimicrobiota bacterium]